jgi:hypothetical protein
MMARILTEQDVARIRVRLLREAALFDDPQTYVAGVEDALSAVLAVTIGRDHIPHETATRMI